MSEPAPSERPGAACWEARRTALIEALERALARALDAAGSTLAAGEEQLLWEPEAFERSLDDWLAGPARLLELLRRVRAHDERVLLPAAGCLDRALDLALAGQRRPQVLRRLSSRDAEAELPAFLAPVLAELLVDAAECVAVGAELQVACAGGVVEVQVDRGALTELQGGMLAGPILEGLAGESGCLRVGAARAQVR